MSLIFRGIRMWLLHKAFLGLHPFSNLASLKHWPLQQSVTSKTSLLAGPLVGLRKAYSLHGPVLPTAICTYMYYSHSVYNKILLYMSYIFLFGNRTDKPMCICPNECGVARHLSGSLLLGSSATLWSHQAFRGASFLLALRQCWTIQQHLHSFALSTLVTVLKGLS